MSNISSRRLPIIIFAGLLITLFTFVFDRAGQQTCGPNALCAQSFWPDKERGLPLAYSYSPGPDLSNHSRSYNLEHFLIDGLVWSTLSGVSIYFYNNSKNRTKV